MLSSINRLILTSTLTAIQAGDFSFCYKMGFTQNEISKLATISADELIILCRMSSQFMRYAIDHDKLVALLNTTAQEASRQSLINQAIILGGSIALLHHFFGLTSNEVCARRRLLAVNVPSGRTPTPDEVIDTEIWQHWKLACISPADSLEGLSAMLLITESLSHHKHAPTLTAVWNRITLFEEMQNTRRGCHAG